MDGHDGLIVLERTVCGKPIRSEVRQLDEGIHVLLTGGDNRHIGAISWVEQGQAAETRVFPGHRDDVLSAPWAEAIAKASGQRTVVVCGIHYDNATPDEIDEIVRVVGEMLREALASFL